MPLGLWLRPTYILILFFDLVSYLRLVAKLISPLIDPLTFFSY